MAASDTTPIQLQNTACVSRGVHRWLLGHDFAQAEGVANLDQVPETGALISIGFARPEGGTGGLARFIAIAPPSWPYGTTIAAAPGAPLPRQTAPLIRWPDGVLRPSH